MSADFISRIVGMFVLAVGGLILGVRLATLAENSVYLYGTTFMLLGALAGLVLTPYLTVRPMRFLRQKIQRMPVQQLLAAIMGLILGLIIASLITFPLSMLPRPLNQILPFLSAVLFGYIGVLVMTARQQEIFAVLRGRIPERSEEWRPLPPVLLDTSVIIDGRIADISRTGFIRSEMLVPRFILTEIQHIADSPDPLRRNRGRRGLDILRRLQEESDFPVRIVDLDVPEARSADDKLVILARRLRCPIVTNDYNLNRVAELQGVTVLNINELANAVRAVYLPGESLRVHIIQEGKEPDQGVGYLDDGTMIVVESGRPFIGGEIEVTVTKILQTAAGRMIFARPAEHL
ncbi:MAG: TRAM domain-containing protein [Anaerolineae bacterium]|nr:TRAM domain-containing protein [Anaerolineae bacterium]MDW8068791.1 TRAM domain-containing protein [Anaerolineae bacterium]